MFKSKRLVLAAVVVFSVIIVLNLNSTTTGNPLSIIAEKLDSVLNLLNNEVIPRLDECCKPLLAVPKTGQTTSYATGDDGDLQMGISWPITRFTDNENGTVTDNMTGLMWVKDGAIILGYRYDWDGVLVFCNNLSLAGYDDWRMPNVREMLSLVDYEMLCPALPAGHPFENINGRYWTSTSHKYNPNTYAFAMYMCYGKAWEISKADLSILVLPVRGGK